MFKKITAVLLLILMLFNTCAFSEGEPTEADDPAEELIDMILEGEEGGEWIDPDLPGKFFFQAADCFIALKDLGNLLTLYAADLHHRF